MGRFGAALAVLASILAFAGCGGDGESADDAAGGGTAAQQESRVLPEELAERLRNDLLIGQQGLRASEADCAIERLGEMLSADQIETAQAAEPLPPDITAVVFEAGARCAGR